VSLLYIVLALVAAQRVLELLYARRNTARLLARGGIESGASHYPLIVVLHAAWLLTMAVLIPPSTPSNWSLLGLHWTTRIVTVQGAPLVRRGPYRFFRHPNYVVVAAEIAVLPLAFGAVTIAATFTALNAAIMVWRIRVEDRALDR